MLLAPTQLPTLLLATAQSPMLLLVKPVSPRFLLFPGESLTLLLTTTQLPTLPFAPILLLATTQSPTLLLAPTQSPTLPLAPKYSSTLLLAPARSPRRLLLSRIRPSTSLLAPMQSPTVLHRQDCRCCGIDAFSGTLLTLAQILIPPPPASDTLSNPMLFTDLVRDPRPVIDFALPRYLTRLNIRWLLSHNHRTSVRRPAPSLVLYHLHGFDLEGYPHECRRILDLPAVQGVLMYHELQIQPLVRHFAHHIRIPLPPARPRPCLSLCGIS